jgi:hypothetical protein
MAQAIGIPQSENTVVLFGTHPNLLYQKDPSVPYDTFVIGEYLIPKKQELTTRYEWANREIVHVLGVFQCEIPAVLHM